jgi:hypothetical protein
VLDRAAYISRTHKVDTIEVRLALTALSCVLENRTGIMAYWNRANNVSGHPWESCREQYYLIAKTCRDAGWHAPV